ncbi:DUF11 domain-containing protein, partial [Streptomyces sp. adm13(2018)]
GRRGRLPGRDGPPVPDPLRLVRRRTQVRSHVAPVVGVVEGPRQVVAEPDVRPVDRAGVPRGEAFVASSLAFSVPVPDLEIAKTASPRTVKPGDTITYTITARNTGTVDRPDVRFGDDLTGTLDDADYRGDVRADLGTATYEAQRIGYRGTVPAGKTATVTYSVKVKDRPAGDGRLLGGVTAETPRSTCGDGSCAGRVPAAVATGRAGCLGRHAAEQPAVAGRPVLHLHRVGDGGRLPGRDGPPVPDPLRLVRRRTQVRS